MRPQVPNRPETPIVCPIGERLFYLETELEKIKAEIADLNGINARMEADYNARIMAMQKNEEKDRMEADYNARIMAMQKKNEEKDRD